MRVDAIVNGAAQTKSAHIRVLCQSTADGLLDSLPILDAMDSAWKASNGSGPIGTRLERQWTVECTSDGDCGFKVLTQPDDSLCGSTPPPPDATGTRRARGHTHPAIPEGYYDTDVLPTGICGDPYPTELKPGPSKADAQNAVNSSIPIYILDGKKIYAVPFGTTFDDAYRHSRKIPRKDGNGCTRV
jgi:hypothetical protein